MSSWNGSITGRLLVDRNAAVAEVSMPLDTSPYVLTATGSSKRDKGDLFDVRTGGRLAYARALKNLARELEKSVNV